jgi:capsular exopolysaccharide synthesis family protein
VSKQEGFDNFSDNGPKSAWFKDDRHASTSLDFKRILYRIQQYWYLVVLSVLVFITAAYLVNRYTTRIYPVNASIIIKGDNERVGAEFLYNSPMLASFKNYDNELFLIKSYPLLQKVIEDLNFTTSFYKEGNIKTSEIYEHVPLEVRSSSGLPYGRTYIIRLINSHQFKIREETSTEFDQHVYSLNDSVKIGDRSLYFKLKPQNGISRYINEDLLLVFNDPLQLARAYASELKVYWADEGASVVNLEISGTSPEKEVDFLNGLIRNYQKFDLEKKSSAATLSLEFIDEQLEIIQDSLQFFERQLERFKNQNTSSDIGAENARLYQKLEEMDRQHAELSIRENYFVYLEKYVKNDAGLDQVVLPNTVGVSDVVLSNLIDEMVKLQINLKMFTNREHNPLVMEARERLSGLRHGILEALNNVKQTDKIKADFIRRQIRLQERQLSHLPTIERELITIKRNYDLSETLYLFLMQKRAEAGINKASTIPDISVVNPPQQVGGPVAPKASRNLIIGLFLGLVVPLMSFFIVEYFNNKIQSKEDIEKITRIPFIGVVGHKNVSHNLVAYENPKSSITEAFRALRSNLTFFTHGKERKVFMVTSSLSGEGKTFTTINLASILAMSGKKTLIIGADMRRPRIFDDFSLHNDFGLSTYLSSNATLDQVIQQTTIDNLYLISGGPIPPNPSELLLRPLMEEMIQQLLERFDFIVIDTPPVGLVTDAFVLSKLTDHTIFVVRQNYTPKELLQSINDFYESGRIKHISILLNDVFRTGAGYGYGYAYGYGSGYGSGEYYEDGDKGLDSRKPSGKKKD